MQGDKILRGRMGRLLFKLSFPPTAGMMVFSGLNLIDTFFIARLGSEALAVLTLSMPLQAFITSLVSATGTGITSEIARKLGGNDLKQADNIAWHAFILTFIYGFIFWLLAKRYIDILFFMLGTPVSSFLLLKEYVLIVLWACIFSFIPITLGNIMQAEGDTLWPVLIALTGMVVNVLLDPFFIFGVGYFKGMGMKGAAWASVIAQVVASLLAVFIIFNRKERILTWKLKNFYPSFQVLQNIYKVGFPAILMEIAGSITMSFFTRAAGMQGGSVLAALGIFLRIRSFVFMPVYGLMQGSMPVASFAYGAANFLRVREAMIKASFFACFYTTLIWFLLQFYPYLFIKLFAYDANLIADGVKAVKMGAMFLPLVGPYLILLNIMQAVGKGTMAMYLFLAKQLGFLLPLLAVLPLYYGADGIWLAFSVSELLAGILSVFFFLRLWRELQKGRKTGMVIFLKWNYMLRRFWAWIKS